MRDTDPAVRRHGHRCGKFADLYLGCNGCEFKPNLELLMAAGWRSAERKLYDNHVGGFAILRGVDGSFGTSRKSQSERKYQ